MSLFRKIWRLVKQTNNISDCTKPFRVDIFTDDNTDTADATANVKHSRGKSNGNETLALQ